MTNGESASGAELLTAALKDNNIAITVGEKTYGKGTVQEVVKLGKNSQYKLTTKKWLTPKGEWINEKGIIPDVVVNQSEKYSTDASYDNDLQLQKAVEILKK